MPPKYQRELTRADFERPREQLERLRDENSSIQCSLSKLQKKLEKIINPDHGINLFPLRKGLPAVLPQKQAIEDKYPLPPNRLVIIEEKRNKMCIRIEKALEASQLWKHPTKPKIRPQSAPLNLFRLRSSSENRAEPDINACNRPSCFRTRFRF